jgi:hypothetical protein
VGDGDGDAVAVGGVGLGATSVKAGWKPIRPPTLKSTILSCPRAVSVSHCSTLGKHQCRVDHTMCPAMRSRSSSCPPTLVVADGVGEADAEGLGDGLAGGLGLAGAPSEGFETTVRM